MKNTSATTVLVVISFLFFIIHQYLQFIAKISWPFADNYLDPALMMPIVLYLIRRERMIVFKDGKQALSILSIMCYFLLTTFVAEVLFPHLSTKFTGDWLDVISYAAGSLAYMIAQKIESDNIGSTIEHKES